QLTKTHQHYRTITSYYSGIYSVPITCLNVSVVVYTTFTPISAAAIESPHCQNINLQFPSVLSLWIINK
ncbi:hypothetical protein DFH05DRAFT_1427737, partial [Lentinula detonsa]